MVLCDHCFLSRKGYNFILVSYYGEIFFNGRYLSEVVVGSLFIPRHSETLVSVTLLDEMTYWRYLIRRMHEYM